MSARALIFSRLQALVISVALVGCVNDPEPPDRALRAGDSLPRFEVVTLEGETVTEQSFQGRRGAIIFFSTSCPDCRRELPRLQKAYEDDTEQRLWICISRSEDASSVGAYWTENGLTMPVAACDDRTVYNLFASRGIPRLFLTDGLRITAAYSETIPELF